MRDIKSLAIYFSLVLLFFLTPLLAFSQSLISLDDSVQNLNRYLQSRLPKNTRVALIIIQSENQEVGEYVLSKIGAVLVNGNWFRVTERNAAALKRIESEMELHTNFSISPETELQIGRQMGAEVIISGSFLPLGQNWRLEIQAINVESAQRIGHLLQDNIRSDSSWNSFSSNIQGKPGEEAYFFGSWTATVEYNNSFDTYQIIFYANGRCTVKVSNDTAKQEANGNWSWDGTIIKLNVIFRNASISYQRNIQWVSVVSFSEGSNSFNILAKPSANGSTMRFTFFRD